LKKGNRTNKGQFSVIAALLVSVILVTSVISTYTIVRHTPLQDSPKVLTAIGEMNSDIKRILDFTIGYYGSILRVTGNSTYARELTTTYLSSGLVNIARSHPEWNPSFDLPDSDTEQFSTCWFMPNSYSRGSINITYSLSALGIEGVKYQTFSSLNVEMLNSSSGVARVNVTRDNSEPELGLTKESFWFYNYSYSDSTWELVNPTDMLVSSNGVYTITIPLGVNQDAYAVQVEDNRGLIVPAFYSQASVASEEGIPQYTYHFDWNSTGMIDIYNSLDTDNFVIELLQNGTLRWLGQPIDITPDERPIPPISIKAFRVNATVGANNRQVPFQVEDWSSDYMVPLGLSTNESIFSNDNMLVFLVNNTVSEITVWWDGNDTATQTPFAWRNVYFTDDLTSNPSYVWLDNGLIELTISKTGNLVVDSRYLSPFSDTYTADFLRVNNDEPDCGSGPSFIISNGIVRDIVQHEPEYSGGVLGCHDFYAQAFVTFPACSTYYTYSVRTIFVNPTQSRTINDLSVIQFSELSGDSLTEDGTSGGYPVSSSSDGLFYDGSPAGWDHHWSQFSSSGSGAGVMFTNSSNENLYVFDSYIGTETGALVVNDGGSKFIEVNPVQINSVPFDYTRDITWYGAVVTFNDEPIHPDSGHDGLWVMVEHPPVVSMDESEEEEPPTPPPSSPLEFYVDYDNSDVDSSPDKGTHSNFPAQQAGPDSTVDMLTEATETGSGIEDYVDNNNSNVDGSEDVGSHNDFSAQQVGPDSSFDILTESSESANSYSLDADGGYMIIGDDVDWGSPAGTISFWIKMDSSVQGRLWGQNGNMETRWSGTRLILDWDGTGAMTSATSFSPDTWYFVAIVWDEDTDDLLLYVGDESNSPTLDSNSQIGTWTGHDLPSPTQNRFMNGLDANQPVDGHGDDLRYWNIARTLTELQSDYNMELTGSESHLRSYFKLNNSFDDIGPDNNDGSSYGDYSFSTDVAFSGTENYELDLEVQFTAVADFLSTNELCIYTGNLGSEDLRVHYWSGSDWQNVATDLTANSWNNFTVSVTSTTFTVRFSGGNDAGDSSVDQWQIDTVLLNSHGNGSTEEAVDNDTSDVDSSSDLGTITNFNNMKAADSTYTNLSESGSGGGITFVNVATESDTSGKNAQINKPAGTQQNDFMIALLVSTRSGDDNGCTMSDAPSGWTLQNDYIQDAYSGQHVYIYWKIAESSEPSNYQWTWAQSCGWVAQITTFRGVNTNSPIDEEGTVNQESSSSPTSPSITTTEENCMIWLYDMCDDNDVPSSGGTPSGTTVIEQTEISSPGNGIGISTACYIQTSAGATGNRDWSLSHYEENSAQQFALKPASTDCRLDQEVQWTGIPYTMPNEYLSIYVGDMGAEDLAVDVWTGSGWETLFTDLSSGWNNASINEWLTDSTFTIRFRDGTEVGDPSPDTWQIDVALIHVWNEGDDNYELDLEVQWTDLEFDKANEELCIYVDEVDSENLGVEVWTGSSWASLTTLNVEWNNVTVHSYLDSSTFTIRFVGTVETDDTTQDYWTIDATLLRCWD
jgi:hypothetical protein